MIPRLNLYYLDDVTTHLDNTFMKYNNINEFIDKVNSLEIGSKLGGWLIVV